MFKRWFLGALAGLTICVAGPASADEFVAIVEDVSELDRGVMPMDLMTEGQTLDLTGDVRVVLGYVHSCIRETITGGKVTIGAEKSTIQDSVRETETVKCDGANIVNAEEERGDVAGVVFRIGKKSRNTLPKPQLTIYGTRPILRVSNSAKSVSIERLDGEDRSSFAVEVHDGNADLGKSGETLEPGGLYSVSAGAATTVLKVSPLAAENAPLLSRIILM